MLHPPHFPNTEPHFPCIIDSSQNCFISLSYNPMNKSFIKTPFAGKPWLSILDYPVPFPFFDHLVPFPTRVYLSPLLSLHTLKNFPPVGSPVNCSPPPPIFPHIPLFLLLPCFAFPPSFPTTLSFPLLPISTFPLFIIATFPLITIPCHVSVLLVLFIFIYNNILVYICCISEYPLSLASKFESHPIFPTSSQRSQSSFVTFSNLDLIFSQVPIIFYSSSVVSIVPPTVFNRLPLLWYSSGNKFFLFSVLSWLPPCPTLYFIFPHSFCHLLIFHFPLPFISSFLLPLYYPIFSSYFSSPCPNQNWL